MALRKIEGLEWPTDAAIDEPMGSAPYLDVMDPRDILIDEAYQRTPSKRSKGLVRKMVANWDWLKFVPPKVVDTPEGRRALDGQHTAMAAATHPLIDRIPVLVHPNAEVEAQANAFVGLNRDRTSITAMQSHRAAVCGENPEALTIEVVCERAGAAICFSQKVEWAVGDTMAVAAIGKLIARRHAKGARRVLEVLVKAGCKPITANEIKAVEALLFDAEFQGELTEDRIAEAYRDDHKAIDAAATTFATESKTRYWRGLVVAIYRAASRG